MNILHANWDGVSGLCWVEVGVGGGRCSRSPLGAEELVLAGSGHLPTVAWLREPCPGPSGQLDHGPP